MLTQTKPSAPRTEQLPDIDHIAMLIPILAGGGAEHVMLALSEQFSRLGRRVDILTLDAHHPDSVRSNQLPDTVRLVDLAVSRSIAAIMPLARYLRHEKPDILLSTLHHANLIAIAAGRIAGNTSPIVVRVPNPLSLIPDRASKRDRIAKWLSRYLLPSAAGIIAVSQAVADNLVDSLKLSPNQIEVIYNPVDVDKIRRLATVAPTPELDIKPETPLVLGVGRLHPQKDFATLIRAFAIVHQTQPAQLLILGEGPERPRLAQLGHALGISDAIAMPGFIENPYPIMQRAHVIVLSSVFEGYPNVLAEALALGKPVISTDCAAAREILAEGRYGKLVPIGDAPALARAIVETLTSPAAEQESLRQGIIDQRIDVIAGQYLATLARIRTMSLDNG
ncbi:MAG: glycosyltransferase [Chloroflexi bacterium]|nr:glycosyltransferase [Chloroflexota bacterium]